MGHHMSGLCTGAAACLHWRAASLLVMRTSGELQQAFHHYTEILLFLCGHIEQSRHIDMGCASAARSPRLAWVACMASPKSTTKAGKGTTMSW